MPLDAETLKKVWEKARTAEGLPETMFRLDACGALIMWDKYGKTNPYGWEVDHVFPQERGGTDHIDNLRALHYKNNRSKADDYPSYTACVKFNGTENVTDERNLTINPIERAKLKKLYPEA